MEVGLIFSWLIEGDEQPPPPRRRVDDLGPLLSSEKKEPGRETAVVPVLFTTDSRQTFPGPVFHVGGRKASDRQDRMGGTFTVLEDLGVFLPSLPFPSLPFPSRPVSKRKHFPSPWLTNFSFMIVSTGRPEQRARSAPAARKSSPLSVTVKRHRRRNLWKDVICRGERSKKKKKKSGDDAPLNALPEEIPEKIEIL